MFACVGVRVRVCGLKYVYVFVCLFVFVCMFVILDQRFHTYVSRITIGPGSTKSTLTPKAATEVHRGKRYKQLKRKMDDAEKTRKDEAKKMRQT